jgi:hypothetical protein
MWCQQGRRREACRLRWLDNVNSILGDFGIGGEVIDIPFETEYLDPLASLAKQ